MTTFYENATVVFTTSEGKKIDTFVVFATDEKTGLTHINYQNLKVDANMLTLHEKTVGRHHMPLDDAFSFEMFSKLKAKYAALDAETKSVKRNIKTTTRKLTVLASAS